MSDSDEVRVDRPDVPDTGQQGQSTSSGSGSSSGTGTQNIDEVRVDTPDAPDTGQQSAGGTTVLVAGPLIIEIIVLSGGLG